MVVVAAADLVLLAAGFQLLFAFSERELGSLALEQVVQKHSVEFVGSLLQHLDTRVNGNDHGYSSVTQNLTQPTRVTGTDHDKLRFLIVKSLEQLP